MIGRDTPKFGTRLGFILATIGSAVGLGNIWRFPFIVGENGGGAFLLPYFISIAFIGIPIMVFEIAAGRSSGAGIVGTLVALSQRFRWLAFAIVIVGLSLLSYYLVITGWSIGYFVYAVLGIHPLFADFIAGNNSVWFFIVALAITVSIVFLGVNRGIEAFSKVMIPLLVILVVGLSAYGMSLPGRDEALRFYLMPRPEALLNPQVWIRALGQAFFSVGVGIGVLVTYGAYVSKSTNLLRSSMIVVIADLGIALLAGLVIFPMAFSFGSDPASGPQLAFDTLPRAFETFGPLAGVVVAILFYLLLCVAAITSAVSMLEAASVAVQEAFRLSRKASLFILVGVVFVLGLPSALSYSSMSLQLFGRRVLDQVDFLVSTVGLPVGVCITALCLGWKGSSLIKLELQTSERTKQSIVWVVRWLVPGVILLLLISMLLKN